MSLLSTTSLLAATALANEPSPEGAPQLLVGVRLSAGAALEERSDPMPMGDLHADVRLVRDRYFLQLSPGLYLPATDTELSYGGLALEVGGGMMLTRTTIAPYVGAGVSGRLQLSGEELHAGFAPYAHLGIDYAFAPRTHLFVEGRAYQNVLPITVGQRTTLPTEVGAAVGLMF